MLSALIGHLVGDFLLQNDWMAMNKKKSSLICSVHCLIWTLCVVLMSGWDYWTAVPLFVTHFIQDRTSIIMWYMDKVGQTEFKKRLGPWSVIIVDNTWHLVAIWAIWQLGNQQPFGFTLSRLQDFIVKLF